MNRMKLNTAVIVAAGRGRRDVGVVVVSGWAVMLVVVGDVFVVMVAVVVSADGCCC